ncbi:peroxidase family protein [Roseiconus lacunae]|uniref:peroxidase family protein n=1 Tax=Roseiconus lacunae TaxID=2605694 RepID=UPI001E33EC3C|nr:peroxidase family protein [Roseiconus lacunae]MCD0462377.1 hypothetical protein [Roseiconus lacunae]
MTDIGFRNKLESALLTRFGFFWGFVQKIPFLRQRLNRFLLNRAIMRTKVRPHQYSLLTDYTSWDSLTQRQYTGRHLPVADERYVKRLPDLDDVVDLFERQRDSEGRYRLSPKSTLLFTNFAQWFTDGFLRTYRDDNDPQAFRRNTSNHEIDLCQIYGLNQKQTAQLRSHQDGKLKTSIHVGNEFPPLYFDEEGNPKPEFSEVTPMIPPSVMRSERKDLMFVGGVERLNVQIGYVMMNTLFVREHNRICDQLKASNPGWAGDDERLFQTARNILIVILLRIVIEEYINHITPYHFKFFLDPSPIRKAEWYRTNWMTMEFNLLYRWHSMIPDKVYVRNQFEDLPATLFNNRIVRERGLGGAFEDASSQVTADVGLLNTHEALVHTERAALDLGRKAKLRSYNEYRELFGFPKVTRWDQISDRKEVRDRLSALYESPDQVELFTGLFAEDVREGSALSPLIGRMVGVDAFSQALTNPLLSVNVFNEDTFTKVGMEIINSTNSLSQLLHRNLGTDSGSTYKIKMTQDGTEVPLLSVGPARASVTETPAEESLEAIREYGADDVFKYK